jgi:hypothetical protein
MGCVKQAAAFSLRSSAATHRFPSAAPAVDKGQKGLHSLADFELA